jgi:hypothetical protein
MDKYKADYKNCQHATDIGSTIYMEIWALHTVGINRNSDI